MSFQLNEVADPRLRARIRQALDAAYDLQSKIKKEIPYETDREIQSPQPQSPVCHEPLGKDAGKKEGAECVTVVITSFRNRLCDTDNLCVKALVDSLRYCRLIKDDRPEDVELLVRQVKCDKQDERTEIEIL